MIVYVCDRKGCKNSSSSDSTTDTGFVIVYIPGIINRPMLCTDCRTSLRMLKRKLDEAHAQSQREWLGI